MDEVEHDILNYQNWGLCYLPKPKAAYIYVFVDADVAADDNVLFFSFCFRFLFFASFSKSEIALAETACEFQVFEKLTPVQN